MDAVRWGVLGVAGIFKHRVAPPLSRSPNFVVSGVPA